MSLLSLRAATRRFTAVVMPSTHARAPWDGRLCLYLVGASLLLSGVVVMFLGVAGQFLPHDERFLGMTASDLCALHGCRIVHFMIHDRVSFGGVLIGIGLLYLWLVAGPLRDGDRWSWWLLLISGIEGFGSFLAYLGYGYLDTWHGLATLAIIPWFIIGMALASRHLDPTMGRRSLFTSGRQVPWRSRQGLGWACLLATAVGMTVGGLTIMVVGMTYVFVPQDLAFMGLSADDLRALNPRLIPLIAHDRAGFGGGVCCCGILLGGCIWCGTPSRGLWLVLFMAGVIGFTAAIGVHPAVGYNDLFHLAPAVAGAVLFAAGMAASYPRRRR